MCPRNYNFFTEIELASIDIVPCLSVRPHNIQRESLLLSTAVHFWVPHQNPRPSGIFLNTIAKFVYLSSFQYGYKIFLSALIRGLLCFSANLWSSACPREDPCWGLTRMHRRTTHANPCTALVNLCRTMYVACKIHFTDHVLHKCVFVIREISLAVS